jgi:hypothetical protein
MRQELDEALVRDFPLTFARNRIGLAPSSLFGFECYDGWEPSIRKTAEKLEVLIAAAVKEDRAAAIPYYYGTSQLKEKFGFGRWYLSSGSNEMYALTDAWEKETQTICERCGKPGKLRGRGWLYTACFEHTKLEDLDGLEIVEHAYAKSEKENGNENIAE